MANPIQQQPRARRSSPPLEDESSAEHHALYTPDFSEMVNQRAKEPAGFFRRGSDDDDTSDDDSEPGTLFDRG